MSYCPKCGTANPDGAQFCSGCGENLGATPVASQPAAVSAAAPAQNPYVASAAASQAPKQEVPTYLLQSILVTLCCCLPFGIASIVFASQVNGKVAAGDIEGALESSRKAKMWAWIGFGAGLVVNIVAVLINVGAAAAAGGM
ncbi:CD225/dispanin family protein [Chitinilyticum aquatile]|uniref:CD225/dispanin family protein n=1 Tax=Chitinilyticum aquatile TaxID=362520 RepID=UPI0003F5C0E7|nr:CD225/dispanin family protein [Chitinilyticum aquatile]